MQENPHLEFLVKAANKDLLISEFTTFQDEIRAMFKECYKHKDGANASYIPELANVPSDNWGVAICTVEG